MAISIRAEKSNGMNMCSVIRIGKQNSKKWMDMVKLEQRLDRR